MARDNSLNGRNSPGVESGLQGLDQREQGAGAFQVYTQVVHGLGINFFARQVIILPDAAQPLVQIDQDFFVEHFRLGWKIKLPPVVQIQTGAASGQF